MKTDPAGAALSAARAAFMTAGGHVSIRSLAEEHGIPLARLRRIAKAQGWAHAARIRFYESRVAREREQLARAREAAAKSARRLLAAVRGRRTPLRELYDAGQEAHSDASWVNTLAIWLHEAQLELEQARTGRQLLRPGFGIGIAARVGWAPQAGRSA